jgi:hypothetical protein
VLPGPRVEAFRRFHLADRELRCDGGRVRSLIAKRDRGKLIMNLGAVVAIAGALPIWPTTEEAFGETVKGKDVSLPAMAIGAGAAVVGWFMKTGSPGDEQLWEFALDSISIGTSTTTDVLQCFGPPGGRRSERSAGGEQTVFEYSADFGTADQVYTLTFREGVLSQIDRANVVRQD